MTTAIGLLVWFVGIAIGCLLWMLETVLFGAIRLWRLTGVVGQVPQVLATETQCARGHRVPLYGRTGCQRCGAIHEGWLFGPCPACQTQPAYVSCPRCGLALPNPLT